MSISAFSNLIQNRVYKEWLAKLDKNIVTSTSDALRDREQTAEKTSFYLTNSNIKNAIKTITGIDVADDLVSEIVTEIRLGASIGTSKSSDTSVQGKKIKVNGEDAIFFESIAFKTITTRITDVLNSIPIIENAYQEAERNFEEAELKQLRNSTEYKRLTTAQKNEAERKITRQAKERATFGYYFNKGHVISVATNLAKQFRDEIDKANTLAAAQKNELLNILDQYIAKLQSDDLATANLPNAINQELYARYTKTSDKYLVELQIKTGNIASGRASIPIIEELRKLFSGQSTQTEIQKILTSSTTLGQSLAVTSGSPSMLKLMIGDIRDSLKFGNPANQKTFSIPKTLIGQKRILIKKPKRKTAAIKAAKKLQNQIKAVKKQDTVKNKPVNFLEQLPQNLTDLQVILNSLLSQKVRENMGSGNRADVLNYRTGRFAQSVKVKEISEGRSGMITAYYTYMKYPYATFSEGGQQQYPRSRDPKLLISKSIREIMQEQMITRMRAVLV